MYIVIGAICFIVGAGIGIAVGIGLTVREAHKYTDTVVGKHLVDDSLQKNS